MAIMNHNKEELVKEYEFWKDKVDHVSFWPVYIYGGVDKELYPVSYDKVFTQDKPPPENLIVCTYPFSGIVILSNGDATICCRDKNVDFNLGNLQSKKNSGCNKQKDNSPTEPNNLF